MNFTVTINGLDQLRAKLSQGEWETKVMALTRGIAEDIRNRIASTPPPVHYPIQWASAKQRRAYFAKRKGNLPYVRETDSMSRRLLAGWTTENRGLDAVVGSGDIFYAPWVQNAQQQQAMHKATGWVTDEQAIKGALDADVPRKVFEEVLKDW